MLLRSNFCVGIFPWRALTNHEYVSSEISIFVDSRIVLSSRLQIASICCSVKQFKSME